MATVKVIGHRTTAQQMTIGKQMIHLSEFRNPLRDGQTRNRYDQFSAPQSRGYWYNSIKEECRNSINESLIKFRHRLIEEEEQIVGAQEKSQQIVAQRLLSCLQYLDATKSSAKDLSHPPVNI